MSFYAVMDVADRISPAYLEKESVPFIALDLDPRRIRDATAAGESVVYGDAAKYEVLIAAGLMRAKLIVVSYTDTISTLKVLRQVSGNTSRITCCRTYIR